LTTKDAKVRDGDRFVSLVRTGEGGSARGSCTGRAL